MAARAWGPDTTAPKLAASKPTDEELEAVLRRAANVCAKLRPTIRASGDRSYVLGVELDCAVLANALADRRAP
jgi:hypothetical protein